MKRNQNLMKLFLSFNKGLQFGHVEREEEIDYNVHYYYY